MKFRSAFKNHIVLFALVFILFPVFCQSETYHLTIRGIDRTFIVYVPSLYDGINPLPVLFMFHGLGGTAIGASSDYYGWPDSSENNGFFVVFPESRDELTPLPTSGGTKYWIVNPGSSDSEDLDFVEEMIQWMDSRYKIRDTHIFCTGHSFGAFSAITQLLISQKRISYNLTVLK